VECLLQYLDDLDDLFGVFGLVSERLRRVMLKLLTVIMATIAAAAGVWLALLHAPIALATSTVLFVILLYRTVTAPVLKSYA
jgi:uncharacterized integral membrane protein